MNAFDKHAKRLAAWCEDCDGVFDTKLEADMHRDQQGHAVRTTEFWVTGRW
ncbi:MAG TPA: hypothetical protein VFA15_00615 [Nitrososphaera sp.]|jgi:hypothetical protein|nr:hypothetical protein [uncultured Nitrososphaera sp.]HZT34391.1 hypothetical protein [Nitrososphaera sp.]